MYSKEIKKSINSMQAMFEMIKAKNRGIKKFDVSQVSKSVLGYVLLKAELLVPTDGGSTRLLTTSVSFESNKKIRNFSSSVKRIRSFKSLKIGMGVRRPPLRYPTQAIDRVPQNLWLTSIFNCSGHLGHKSTKVPVSRAWLPPIGDYLVGNRNRVAVINSHLVLERAVKGLYLSATVLRKKGHILVVDTRGEASPLPNLIESSNYHIPTSISFSGPRWMGGSLTNWASISVMVRRCAQISKQFDEIITQNRTHIPRYEKMRDAFPGFIKTSHPHGEYTRVSDPLDGRERKSSHFMRTRRIFSPSVKEKVNMTCFPLESKEAEDFFNLPDVYNIGYKHHQARLRFKCRPDLLWILNPNENRHVIEEAEKLSIPTIGIVDSNTNLSGVTVSIPANDNGSFLVNQLITILLTLSKDSSKCL